MAHKVAILSLVSVIWVRRLSYRMLEGSTLREIENGKVLRVQRRNTLYSRVTSLNSAIKAGIDRAYSTYDFGM